LRSPSAGPVREGNRGDGAAHRRARGGPRAPADGDQPVDGAALAARGQEVARAVRDADAQAAPRHPRSDAPDGGRADEARPALPRGRRDQVLTAGAPIMAKGMKQGLIARKRGMTQVFAADGNSVPVTVLEAGPCTVVQVKTRATDGYDALQLGFEPKRRKVPKPMAGHFKKAGVGAVRVLREVRIESADGYQVGQLLSVDLFKPGELVDVTGLRKGRGFQGGIKRHGWTGGGGGGGARWPPTP